MSTSRLHVPQFRIPNERWAKLQESQYLENTYLGIPDERKDCCVNTFAFMGALKREEAEKIAKVVNEENRGIMPNDAAAYLENKSGYEKSPHGITMMSTLSEVFNAYKDVKENCASLIAISRADGTGHAATIVCIGRKLMIFDPQSEVLSENIAEWLDNERAIRVETILKLDKRVHCRDEATVCIRKDEGDGRKWRKIEEKEPAWKIRNAAKSRERARENAMREFVENMTLVGFSSLIC